MRRSLHTPTQDTSSLDALVLLEGDAPSRRNSAAGLFIDIVMEDRRNATEIFGVHAHAISVTTILPVFRQSCVTVAPVFRQASALMPPDDSVVHRPSFTPSMKRDPEVRTRAGRGVNSRDTSAIDISLTT